MELSKKGIELIKELEGFKEELYKCSANKLIIGYVHVIKDWEVELKTKKLTKDETQNLT